MYSRARVEPKEILNDQPDRNDATVQSFLLDTARNSNAFAEPNNHVTRDNLRDIVSPSPFYSVLPDEDVLRDAPTTGATMDLGQRHDATGPQLIPETTQITNTLSVTHSKGVLGTIAHSAGGSATSNPTTMNIGLNGATIPDHGEKYSLWTVNTTFNTSFSSGADTSGVSLKHKRGHPNGGKNKDGSAAALLKPDADIPKKKRGRPPKVIFIMISCFFFSASIYELFMFYFLFLSAETRR
jgi:hypothetical protein